MDVTNLILNLKNTITDDPLEQQMISKAIKLLQVGTVDNVSSFSNLPDPAQNAGKIYLVDFDGLYFSDNLAWLPITTTQYTLAYGWGETPTTLYSGFSTYSSISGTSALLEDGTIWSIGETTATPAPGNITDWCHVDIGGHCFAIRQDGTAYAWGANGGLGRLGVGDTAGRSTPTLILGGFTDWCQLSASTGSHSLGVRKNGTAWGWGYGGKGQLGDGVTGNAQSKVSPVSVACGFTDWTQVSAGGNAFSIGLRANGTVWAWGCGANGRLGNNSTINRLAPVSVCGGFTDWCQISAGGSHGTGIRSNGTVYAWGLGTSGQLGNNFAIDRCTPVAVVGGFTDWCQVSSRNVSHNVGIRTNGQVWSWGFGTSGQMGDGQSTNRSSPVSLSGGFTDWCFVTTAGNSSRGIRKIQL